MTQIALPLEELLDALALKSLTLGDERHPHGEVVLFTRDGYRWWAARGSDVAAEMRGGAESHEFGVNLSWAMLYSSPVVASGNEDTVLQIDLDVPNWAGDLVNRLAGPGGMTECSRSRHPVEPPPFPRYKESRLAGSATIDLPRLRQLIRSACYRRAVDESGEPLATSTVALSFRDGNIIVSIQDRVVGVTELWLNAPGASSRAMVFIDPLRLVHLLDVLPEFGEVTIDLPTLNTDPLILRGVEFRAGMYPLKTHRRAVAERVEALIEQVFGGVAVSVDDDGDYPLQRRGVPVFGRFHHDAEEVTWFRVFAVIATGIAASEELYRELNDLNTTGRYVRLFHVEDQILAEVDLLAESLDEEELREAILRIESISEEVMPTLTAVLGGAASVDASEARWVLYRETVLEAEISPGVVVALNGSNAVEEWPFPGEIHVITGWNPQGVHYSEVENRNINRLIARDLVELDGQFIRGIGRSADREHHEESLVVWNLEREQVIELGRKAQQDAIFEVNSEEVRLVSCSDDRLESWPRVS